MHAKQHAETTAIYGNARRLSASTSHKRESFFVAISHAPHCSQRPITHQVSSLIVDPSIFPKQLGNKSSLFHVLPQSVHFNWLISIDFWPKQLNLVWRGAVSVRVPCVPDSMAVNAISKISGGLDHHRTTQKLPFLTNLSIGKYSDMELSIIISYELCLFVWCPCDGWTLDIGYGIIWLDTQMQANTIWHASMYQ